MADQIGCPDVESLRRLMLGRAAADEARSLGEHLLHCAQCAETVHSIDATDLLVQAARAGKNAAQHPDQAHIAALIRRLQQIPAPSAAVASPPTEGAAGGETPSESDPVQDWTALLAPPQDPAEIGRLGPYRVLRFLGSGGMGVVFAAEDTQLKRLVALKAMKPDLAASPLHRQRFQREAQAIARLEHDHIVTIYQVGEDRGIPFLAMPLLKGETLESRLMRERQGTKIVPLPVEDAVRIGREIAEGLAAAHEHGVTHRDVKPANIWLEKTTGRVKILDFGLARPAEDNAHLTQTGTVAGTPQYMAPEQAAGQPANHLSDLFSLGCVLYRVLTGILPFRGANTLAVLRALAVEPPPPPRDVNPVVPVALSGLTMRLLAKEPRSRPQSAQEVVEALAKIQKTAGTQPPANNRTRSVLATLSGRRAAWITAGVLLVCSPLAVWWAPAMYRFVTNQGQLVIETDDPAVEVSVKQDGRLIRVVDTKTGKEVTLKAGVYQLELSGDTKQGLKLEADQLTLTRGGREIVRIRREPATHVAASAPVTAVPPAPLVQPFAILGHDGRAEQTFATLAEAVSVAMHGDTIEVRGDGPVIRESIIISGKALTIRAASGSRPVLEFTPTSLGEGWDKYVRLQTDAQLVLEGLAIRRVGPTGEKVKRAEWAVVCQHAPLRVANCRFVISTEPGTVALWGDESALCEVRNCEFVLGPGCGSMDWVCPAVGRLLWDNNVTAVGRGPACHYRRSGEDISVQLTRSTFLGPALHFNLGLPQQAALSEASQATPPCRVELSASVVNADYVLGFFQGFPQYVPQTKALPAAEAEALLRRLVAWRGERNVYPRHVNLLGLGAQQAALEPTRVRNTLDDFRQFWGPIDTDSLQGNILHQGGDLAAKAVASPDQLSPSDFRLRRESTGYRAAVGDGDLGADVDLVGPGAAYERWKKTLAYQQWLKDAGQLP
jgi:serine/threonine protein kinase